MECTIYPLGDQAAVCRLGEAGGDDTEKRIRAAAERLEADPPEWLIEFVTSYTSVTVYYDIRKFRSGHAPFDCVQRDLQHLMETAAPAGEVSRRTVRLPVLYGGEAGPDLAELALRKGLSEEEVIRLHAAGNYTVRMIGFSPGFPFLSGLPPILSTPRKETPRLRIPARSVGIAGGQAGVYPMETPGGWQLIGRTPCELFLPGRVPPSLLHPGDRLEFYPITQAQYDEWREGRI